MSNFLKPAEISSAIEEAAVSKASLTTGKMIILGILAGVYIGFAAHLATSIATGSVEWIGAKKFLTGAVFSFGLMLVIIPGSELWTGNNLMVMPLSNGKITLTQMLRNWFWVYTGNFIGSVLIAFIIAGNTGILDGPVGATALKIAVGKVTASPEGLDHNWAYFFRGVGCNWLVCLAVFMAMSAKDIGGKILGIFFPIMAFVASGFEHCVANMYFLPAGIFAKAFTKAKEMSGLTESQLQTLNWQSIWTDNLMTVTLGNFVGGAIFVGMAYWFVFLRETDGNA